MPPVRVCKFGGTSVADEHLLQVAHLMARLAAPEEPLRPVVVVSAMAGVTTQLMHLAHAAQNAAASPAFAQLCERHARAAERLDLPAGQRRRLDADLAAAFQALARDLANVSGRGAAGKAQVIAWGERFSVLLLAAALQSAGVPAASVLEPVVVTEPLSDLGVVAGARPRLEETKRLVRERVLPLVKRGMIPIVPGYVGQSLAGDPTLLSRGGSDWTATLVAGALPGCEEVQIWTDVAGVWSANPREVPDAVLLPALSSADAARLAQAGAKVLHPETLSPLMDQGIPVRVLNSFAPEQPGTLIAPTAAGTPLEALAVRRGLVCFRWPCDPAEPAWLDLLLRAGVTPVAFSASAGASATLVVEALAAEWVEEQLRQAIGAALICDQGVAACTYLCSHALPLELLGQATLALSQEAIPVMGFSVGTQAALFLVPEAEAVRVERLLHRCLIREAVLAA